MPKLEEYQEQFEKLEKNLERSRKWINETLKEKSKIKGKETDEFQEFMDLIESNLNKKSSVDKIDYFLWKHFQFKNALKRKKILDKIKEKTKISLKTLQRRCGEILEKIKEKYSKETPSEFEEEWSQEYIEKSEKLLENPKLLEKILKVIRKGEDRIIGEKEKCLLTYLHCLSTFTLEKPIHLKISGSSSGGKNYILENVLRTFPSWTKINLKRISKEFINYINQKEDFFKNKIFVISEGAGVEEAKESLKLSLSQDGEGIGIVDTEGQKIGPRIIKSKAGVPSFITTTASGIEDSELNNRLNTMGITETEEQTKKIRDYEIDVDYHPWKYEESDKFKELTKTVQHIPYHFERRKDRRVINPFSRTMSRILSTTHLNYRRNFPKMKSVLKLLAIINRKRRKKIKKNGKEYIIANLEDYLNWYFIVRDEVAKTELNLEGALETFKDRLKELQEEEDLPEKFTVSDIHNYFKEYYDKKTVRTYLYRLNDKGLIEQDPETFGKGKSNKYRINNLEVISSNNITQNLFFPLIEYLSYLNSSVILKTEIREKESVEIFSPFIPPFSKIKIEYNTQKKQPEFSLGEKESNDSYNITQYNLKANNPTNKTIRELIENPTLLFNPKRNQEEKILNYFKENPGKEEFDCHRKVGLSIEDTAEIIKKMIEEGDLAHHKDGYKVP